MMDPGDEDDITARREVERWLTLWRFHEGPCRIYYAAVRVTSGVDHDPGDEQPQLIPHPSLAIL